MLAGSTEIGSKGATVYCFMRISGNDHEVSWKAAYEIIKRQKSSLFKTSPKHGAVMIVETVVSEPEKYQDCGVYLGDLYRATGKPYIQEEKDLDKNDFPSKSQSKDRYTY